MDNDIRQHAWIYLPSGYTKTIEQIPGQPTHAVFGVEEWIHKRAIRNTVKSF